MQVINTICLFFFEALERDVLVEGQQPSNGKDDGQQSKGKDEETISCELGVGPRLIVSADDLVPSDSYSYEGDHKGLVEDNSHVMQ